MKRFYFQPEAVNSVTVNRRKNTFAFLFTAYFFALQEYFKKNKADTEKQRAPIYNAPPKDVIVWMLKVLGKEKDGKPIKVYDKEEKEKDGAYFFLSNMNKLQDLMQAKMLQDLDKGKNRCFFLKKNTLGMNAKRSFFFLWRISNCL